MNSLDNLQKYLLARRSTESSQYKENEVLTIEVVEQEAATRNHSFLDIVV